MARVRATCDECGDVELAISGVSVRICRDRDEGTYQFDCPVCSQSHENAASRRTLDLLAASGAEVSFWSTPVERILNPNIGPLTHDELLDFHAFIGDDSRIEAALGHLSEECI